MYTVGSFFSGIGGLDLAFVWAGFEIMFHVEIDPYCREVLRKNAKEYWPKAKSFKDIKKVKASQLGHPTVLVGGFPCQDISIAGKRAGIAKGNRSGLWFEFLRLIRQVRPAVVVLENVSAIHVPTRDEHGNEQQAPGLIVAATLSEVGYDAVWIPVRASDIGAPHQRERWFCVAYRKSDDGRRIRRAMGNAPRNPRKQNDGRESMGKSASRRKKLANSTRQRLQERRESYTEQAEWASFSSETHRGHGLEQLDNPESKRPAERGNRGGSKATYTKSHNSSRGIGRKRSSLKSRLGRTAHGFSRRLDRHQGQWPARPNSEQYAYEPSRVTGRKENRVARIKALGNAVVPQQAYPIAMAVKMFLDETQAA